MSLIIFVAAEATALTRKKLRNLRQSRWPGTTDAAHPAGCCSGRPDEIHRPHCPQCDESKSIFRD